MPNTHATLTSLFSDIADAIRAKTGSQATIVADNFPTAIAAIPQGGSPTLQTKSKSYTPSETAQSEAVTADNGYDGLDTVNVSVAAVSSTYVGSGITRRDSTDLSASGATVTAPAGYYASQATKTVSSGTAGTPSASKTIAGTTATITPSVTNTTGYITGSTKTGTAVTVTASEVDTLGTKSITSNGNNIDVVGYSAVNVSVSGTSKNTQVVQGTTRTTSSTLTAIGAEMTVSKTGTYDVYWSAFRSSTSSSYTYATQLFIDGAAYGSENATWSNHVQNNHLTNVSLTLNQKIRVRGRESRNSSYYIYAPTLVIVEN